MASIGLAYPVFAKITGETASALPTYAAGITLGAAVKADLTITNATGQLYADNQLIEDVSEFANAAIALETDNLTLTTQAAIFGATLVGGELGFGADDVAPFGGFGYYQVLMINGVKKFRAFYYPKVKAKFETETASTKSGSITFGNAAIALTVVKPKFGKWRYVKEFDTEEAAKGYIDTKLSVAAWHEINVLVSGASTGEGASPEGITMVANGEDFTLTITGTPAALYDNGEDVKESITGGAYALTNVTTAHNIAVIF
jgi:hypothetical protein